MVKIRIISESPFEFVENGDPNTAIHFTREDVIKGNRDHVYNGKITDALKQLETDGYIMIDPIEPVKRTRKTSGNSNG